MKHVWRGLLIVPSWSLLFVLTIWAAGAFYFDLPIATLHVPAAIIYGLASVALFVLVRKRWGAAGILGAGFVIVLLWWLTIRPTEDRASKPDVARRAWADIHDDEITLHNVRELRISHRDRLHSAMGNARSTCRNLAARTWRSRIPGFTLDRSVRWFGPAEPLVRE